MKAGASTSRAGTRVVGLDEVNESDDEVAGVEAPGQEPPRDIDLGAADPAFCERTDVLHDGARSMKDGGIANIVAAIHLSLIHI